MKVSSLINALINIPHKYYYDKKCALICEYCNHMQGDKACLTFKYQNNFFSSNKTIEKEISM